MSKSKFTNEQRRNIEDQIIAALDAGVSPWNRPWTAGGPRNFTTNNTYNGMLNLLVLSAVAGINGWGDDWAGKGQIQKAGGKVAADATPTTILAPIMSKFTKEQEDGTTVTINYIKGFRDVKVFNLAQADGVTVEARNENTDDPIEAADAMIAAMPLAPQIVHGGSSAHYTPMFDQVTLPQFADFDDAPAYYAVAFHELAHATGAEKRLNREGVAQVDTRNIEQYAAEELVAEIAAAHLIALAGVERIVPSASYIKGWASRLKDEREMILTAMEQAADAVKWIEGSHYKAKKLTEAQQQG